jgi:hypothetical protein
MIATVTPMAQTLPRTAEAKTNDTAAQRVVKPRSQRSENRGMSIRSIVADEAAVASKIAAGRLFDEDTRLLEAARQDYLANSRWASRTPAARRATSSSVL